MPAKPTVRNTRPVRSTRAPEKKTTPEKRAAPSASDQTVLRSQIKTSISSVTDITKILETATPQVQDILRAECSVIYECRVCLSLFRSIANFISHKRAYCLTKYQDIVIDTEKHHERTLILQSGGSNVIYSRTTSKKDIALMLDSIASRARSDGIYFDANVLKPIPGTDEADKVVFKETSTKSVEVVTLGPDGKVLSEPPTLTDVRLSCSFCPTKFESTKALSTHVRSEHGNLVMCMVCPCCKMYFSNYWSVFRHLYKVHHKSSDQVRKLRPQIQRKEVTLDEFNQSRKLIYGNGIDDSSQNEDDGFSEELKYMEQKCYYCGRKFERKVALISHTNACMKKFNAAQPASNSPSRDSSSEGDKNEKRAGIQVRMFYDKVSKVLPDPPQPSTLPQARVILTKSNMMMRSLEGTSETTEKDSKPDEQVDDVVSRYMEEMDPDKKGSKLENALRKLYNNKVDIEEIESSSIESPLDGGSSEDEKTCVNAIINGGNHPKPSDQKPTENESSSGSECQVSSSTAFLTEVIDLDETSNEGDEMESFSKPNKTPSICFSDNGSTTPFQGFGELGEDVTYVKDSSEEEEDETREFHSQDEGAGDDMEIRNLMTDRAVQVEDQEFEDEEIQVLSDDQLSQDSFIFQVVSEEEEEEEETGSERAKEEGSVANKHEERCQISDELYDSDECDVVLHSNPGLYKITLDCGASEMSINCQSEDSSSSNGTNNHLPNDSTNRVLDSEPVLLKPFTTSQPLLNGVKGSSSHHCETESGEESDFNSPTDHRIDLSSIIDVEKKRCLKCCRKYATIHSLNQHALLHLKDKFRCLINCCSFKASFKKDILRHLLDVHKVKETDKCYETIYSDKSDRSTSKDGHNGDDSTSNNCLGINGDGDGSDVEFPHPQEKKPRLDFSLPPSTVSPTPSFEYEASTSGDSKAMQDLNSANESNDKLKKLMMQVIFGNESLSLNGLDSI